MTTKAKRPAAKKTKVAAAVPSHKANMATNIHRPAVAEPGDVENKAKAAAATAEMQAKAADQRQKVFDSVAISMQRVVAQVEAQRNVAQSQLAMAQAHNVTLEEALNTSRAEIESIRGELEMCKSALLESQAARAAGT